MGAILLLTLLLYPIPGINAQSNDSNENVFLSKCIVEIAKRDLNYKPTLLIYDSVKTQLNNDLFEALLTEAHISGVPNIIMNEEISNNTLENGDILLIFIVNDCVDLNNMNFNKEIKYLIIFRINCQQYFKMLKELITHYVVAMETNFSGDFTLNTAIFDIDETTCDIIDEVILQEVNVCINGTLSRRNKIFPDRSVVNLKKCSLNAGIGELYPYMLLNNNTRKYENLNSISEAEIRGSDVVILKLLSEYFNSTLNFFFIYKDQENPFVDQTFLSLLLNGSLNICAGGLYRIYGDIVDYSGVYTRQAVVWAYSIEREIRSWQSFVTKVNGLYFFLIFYVIHVAMWKIISKIDNEIFSLKQTLLYSWGALIGASSLHDARTIKQKIVNAMYLILCLHLSAYISVQLYSYLTIQSPPRLYRTIDELMASGIKPYLKPTSKYFIKDQKYEKFANTSGDCDSFIDCQKVIIEKKGTTVLIEGYMPVYQFKTAVNDEARVLQLKENIIFVYHEMIIRKNIVFGSALKKVMLHLFEAGICEKLYEEAVGILLAAKGKFAAKNLMSNSYSCQSGCKITLTQSAGAFYIWIFGCILSFVAFIVEVVFVKYKNVNLIEQKLN